MLFVSFSNYLIKDSSNWRWKYEQKILIGFNQFEIGCFQVFFNFDVFAVPCRPVIESHYWQRSHIIFNEDLRKNRLFCSVRVLSDSIFVPPPLAELYTQMGSFIQTILADRCIHCREMSVISLKSLSHVEFETKMIILIFVFLGVFEV